VARKLIVGQDGSEQGNDALALCGVLANCLAATALVAHVRPPLPHIPLSPQVEEIIEGEVEALLDAARERLAPREVEVRALVSTSPARALHELAEAEDPIALVLGAPHRGAVGRVMLGSVGTALLSGAPCAVAVAPRGYAERAERRVQKLCVAIDGSEEASIALSAAAGIAGRVHGSLTVVGVAEPVRYEYPTPYPVLDPVREQREREQAIEDLLDRAMEHLPEGLQTDRRSAMGDPAPLIAEAGSDHDLLIVGSRAYGPVRRALLGSVSAKLMGLAPSPVLVLPRGAGHDPLGLGGVESAASSSGNR
jgi:nucleotide-binding universal stress UspA family protein